jgi:16S rRNA (adenine1518-N6/adenine1519-N6)-dimethyltransferase
VESKLPDDRRSPAGLLRELGITPSKALGQHFLHDRGIVERIVRESGVGPHDTVLEIGPGLGILTRQLAVTARRVIAIERDQRLADGLIQENIKGVEIVVADALESNFASLTGPGDYHVVANLPYSVGTAIIQHLQESSHPPATLTLMLQREVAERIVAVPPDMNLLAVGVQYHGDPKLLFRIGRGAFVPPPNVQSAVIRIITHSHPPLPVTERDLFFRIVTAGFAHPRKQLVNNIISGLGVVRVEALNILESAQIDPTLRPERMSIADWLRLHSVVADLKRISL